MANDTGTGVGLSPGDGWTAALLAHQEKVARELEAYPFEARRNGDGLRVYREYMAVCSAIYQWATHEEVNLGVLQQRRMASATSLADMLSRAFPNTKVQQAMSAGCPAMLEGQ